MPTQHGHNHAEAFCLMWYACRACGTRHRIWNSRDGVTPFGTTCPGCGSTSFMHADWQRDIYAPNHTPHRLQFYWKSLTKAEWVRVFRAKYRAFPPSDLSEQALTDFIDGQATECATMGSPYLAVNLGDGMP